MNRLAAMVVGLALVLCACQSTSSPSPTAGPSASPSPTSGGVIPESPIVGVVIDVDSEGLAAVHGFTLRTAAGLRFEFEIGELENATEFPPGHLHEHVATSSPVRVFFRVDGVRLVAYRIEDAD